VKQISELAVAGARKWCALLANSLIFVAAWMRQHACAAANASARPGRYGG
jgi:hypothetical protein